MKTLSIPTLTSIIQDIQRANLSLDQLEQLASFVNAERSFKMGDGNPQGDQAIALSGESKKNKLDATNFEWKTITKPSGVVCGPYLYERIELGYRNGKRIRKTIYHGKFYSEEKSVKGRSSLGL